MVKKEIPGDLVDLVKEDLQESLVYQVPLADLGIWEIKGTVDCLERLAIKETLEELAHLVDQETRVMPDLQEGLELRDHLVSFNMHVNFKLNLNLNIAVFIRRIETMKSLS